MSSSQSFNANPEIFVPSVESFRQGKSDTIWVPYGEPESDEEEEDSAIDAQEVYDLIRSINDPEHPLTLEQLKVVSLEQVKVEGNRVFVEFTPTTPACGMANVIGLAIMVRLYRSLPMRYKVKIGMTPGSHQHVNQVTKQLNDKERVAAAMEVDAIMENINACLATAGRRGRPE